MVAVPFASMLTDGASLRVATNKIHEPHNRWGTELNSEVQREQNY